MITTRQTTAASRTRGHWLPAESQLGAESRQASGGSETGQGRAGQAWPNIWHNIYAIIYATLLHTAAVAGTRTESHAHALYISGLGVSLCPLPVQARSVRGQMPHWRYLNCVYCMLPASQMNGHIIWPCLIILFLLSTFRKLHKFAIDVNS